MRITQLCRLAALAVVTIGLLGGCGGGEGPKSGVSGVVINEVVGGAPENPPSDIALSDATVTVKAATGRTEIAHQNTGADGSFRIDLSPGTYQVSASRAVDPGFGTEQSVTVQSGAYTQVTLKGITDVP